MRRRLPTYPRLSREIPKDPQKSPKNKKSIKTSANPLNSVLISIELSVSQANFAVFLCFHYIVRMRTNKHTPSPAQELPRKIARLHALTRARIEALLAQHGITDIEPCHGDIFTVLFAEKRLPLTELAAKTHRCKSTVSVMVARLVKAGWLQKTADPEDARRITVALTEKGRKLEGIFEAVSEALIKDLSAGFTEEELRVFEGLMDRMSDNFS